MNIPPSVNSSLSLVVYMELDNTDILILTWTTLTTKKRLRGRETSTSSMEPSVMKLAK